MIKTKIHKVIIPTFFILISYTLLIYKLEQVPPPWFDEGWNFSTARNWIELGYYGHLLNGQPTPPTYLSTGGSVILPIAVTLKYLGVGVWQGRAPTVAFTIILLATYYKLARKLFGYRVAILSTSLTIMIPQQVNVHPLLIGKQALGEVPSLCFLILGYWAFIQALDAKKRHLLVSVTFWALALNTKAQLLPFFVFSLLAPLLITVYRKNREYIKRFSTGLILTLLVTFLLGKLETTFLQYQAPQTTQPGLYTFLQSKSYLWLSFSKQARLRSFHTLLTNGILPISGGLIYASIKIITRNAGQNKLQSNHLCQLMILAFAGSYFIWFLLLSVGWPRYFFPVCFVGCIFTGYLLESAYNLLRKLSNHRNPKHKTYATIILGAISLILITNIYETSVFLHDTFKYKANGFYDTIRYLNQTPQDTIIEVYDAELFLLLERAYHYPPLEVQNRANLKNFSGESVEIEYNLWQNKADFVVIGPMTKLWQLYNSVMTHPNYEKVVDYSPYQVYKLIK